MPKRPPRPCVRCGAKATRSGHCDRHAQQADRHRGNPTQRGYGTEHRTRFRDAVLSASDHTCVLCGAVATVADHYPRRRRELVTLGLDANDPQYGRALCASCHSRHTVQSNKQSNKQAFETHG